MKCLEAEANENKKPHSKKNAAALRETLILQFNQRFPGAGNKKYIPRGCNHSSSAFVSVITIQAIKFSGGEGGFLIGHFF